ncbi:MAG: fibro-slime domain-containing protein [Phycisphaeraceae bacterium]|nr:fibro-slime domain-containing protein [Phycisphaeraceae bacterium]
MNRQSSSVFASVSVLGVLAAAGLAMVSAPHSGAAATADPFEHLPTSLTLSGVVRDFKELSVSQGGHADFERTPTRGFGMYAGEVADQLDADGKPVFQSTGYKVSTQWRDSMNRNISPPRSHIAAKPGDIAGVKETSLGGSTTNAENFAKWFRDVPGVNMAAPYAVTLKRQPNSNMYTFDDKTDELFKGRGGFFPINGELFGNSSGETKNFHFTYEIDTRFVYKRGAGQVFTFTGDDDVFVFIDGKCVIDLGGVHSAVSQTIDLDRLAWLQDNKTYSLKFFFAERHRTQSNFRIDTTLTLLPAQLPSAAAVFD